MSRLRKACGFMVLVTVLVLFAFTANAENVDITHNEEDGAYYVNKDKADERVIYCLNHEAMWPEPDDSSAAWSINNEYLEDRIKANPKYEGKEEETYKKLRIELARLLYAGYPTNGYALFSTESTYWKAEYFQDMITPPDGFEKLTSLKLIDNQEYDLSAWKNESWTWGVQGGHVDTAIQWAEKLLTTLTAIDLGQITDPDILQQKSTLVQLGESGFCKAICIAAQARKDGSWSQPLTDQKLHDLAMTANVWHTAAYTARYATQLAVWQLMYDYGIEGNVPMDLEMNKLAKSIYQFGKNDRMQILDAEPQRELKFLQNGREVSQIHFTYNSASGRFESGPVSIANPSSAHYKPWYTITLPAGMQGVSNGMPLHRVPSGQTFYLYTDNVNTAQKLKVTWQARWAGAVEVFEEQSNSTQYQRMGGVQVFSKQFEGEIGFSVKFVPKTGDGTPVGMLAGVLTVSFLGLILLKKRTKIKA